jgi:hypothetical protein
VVGKPDQVDLLDPGDQVAHLAGVETGTRVDLGAPHPELVGLYVEVRRHEPDGIPLGHGTIDDANVADHAAVGVVVGVEDQGPQRRLGIAVRRGQALDDGLEQLVDALTRLRRHPQHLVRRPSHHRGKLGGDAIGVGGGEIDLVDHRDDLQILLDGHIGVGQRLGLHALRGVDHQQRPLARLEAARHLVGEVDVAGGVDEVQLVGVAGGVFVVDPDRVRLDGDAPLALDLHLVEHLVAHVALGDGSGSLQQAVGEGRLAVVDVGDDGEVAYARLIGHW